MRWRRCGVARCGSWTSGSGRSLASPINDQMLLLEYDATERWSWILSRNEDSQTYALEFRVRHSF